MTGQREHQLFVQCFLEHLHLSRRELLKDREPKQESLWLRVYNYSEPTSESTRRQLIPKLNVMSGNRLRVEKPRRSDRPIEPSGEKAYFESLFYSTRKPEIARAITNC
jgi:hypothetical protein